MTTPKTSPVAESVVEKVAAIIRDHNPKPCGVEWPRNAAVAILAAMPCPIEDDTPTDELERGKDELRRLMESIWRAEYRKDAPNWKPLEDLPGMISQIDNMYAGVRQQRDQARWDLHNPPAATAGLVGELVEALRKLEQANDDLCATRSQVTYNSMIHHDKAHDHLLALDEARCNARTALSKAKDLPHG